MATGSTVSVGVLTEQAGANNAVWRVVYVGADTFNLVDPVTLDPAVVNTTSTTGPVGTVTRVAQPDFGSPTFVDADAALNGSSQTATATTYNYSAVDITPLYTSDVAPNPAMRTAPCRVWIPEVLIASPYSANGGGQALIAEFEAYIV